MSSEPWVQSPVLDTHLRWHLEQLESMASKVKNLIVQGWEVDLFCFSQGKVEEPPPLPAETRKRAEGLGVLIDIDYYCLPNKTDQDSD